MADNASNQTIADLIDDPEMGQWNEDADGLRVYTPNMNMFAELKPSELSAYFKAHGGGVHFLHLP